MKLNQDELSFNCLHTKVENITFLHANSLFPAINLRNKKIFLGGLNIKRCEYCGEILWNGLPDVLKDELENQILQFLKSSSYPNNTILLYYGDTNELKKELLKSDNIAEEANFIHTFPKFKLADVILPKTTSDEIEKIFSFIQFRDLIYNNWNFSKVDPIGKGVAMLFYGESGTGKTRTAEAIAGELSIPFISVSLKDLESRFMGQTPKNISKAFAEAKKNNAMLFFDEADTVLGKRLSSVTTGVDNEVNMERSTLLKELETYEGICGFATNFQENIDSAFRRRINFHIKFDLPDLATRNKLLEYYLLPTIPLKEERKELIMQVAEITEGFSGADIVQALRQSFINGIKENSESTKISIDNITNGVLNIQNAKINIGQSTSKSSLKSMFNLKTNHDEFI